MRLQVLLGYFATPGAGRSLSSVPGGCAYQHMHSMRMSSSTELRRSGESGCTVTVSGCSILRTSPVLGPSQLTAVGPAPHTCSENQHNWCWVIS